MDSHPHLSSEELIRYSRHLRLPGFDTDSQLKLRNSRVLIVGMGGLGSPASLYLAAGGVGTLGLADFDRVETHNLQRQIVHTEASVGGTKLESARQRLSALNSAIQLNLYPEGITTENGIAIFSDYDVILDGSDNFPTRYLCNDLAYFTGKPLVHASIFQFEGQIATFHSAAGTPCYRCLFPQMPEPGTVPNCDQAGVLGALSGITGCMQALETIKLLTGLGDNLLGKLMAIDTLNMHWRTLNPAREAECPLCGEHPEILEVNPSLYESKSSCEPAPTQVEAGTLAEEIDPQTAARMLQEEAPAPLLLDVREEFEYAIVNLPGSMLIPLRELPDRWADLPDDKPVLVYCHHGMRSLQATRFLRDRNCSNVASIRGGIDLWARTLDSSLARY